MAALNYVISDNVTISLIEDMKGLGAYIGITFTVVPQNEDVIIIPDGSLTYATISFIQDGEQVCITQLINVTQLSKEDPVTLEGVYYPGGEPFKEASLPIANIIAAIYYYEGNN